MENPKEEIEAILNEMNFTNPFEVQKELFKTLHYIMHTSLTQTLQKRLGTNMKLDRHYTNL